MLREHSFCCVKTVYKRGALNEKLPEKGGPSLQLTGDSCCDTCPRLAVLIDASQAPPPNERTAALKMLIGETLLHMSYRFISSLLLSSRPTLEPSNSLASCSSSWSRPASNSSMTAPFHVEPLQVFWFGLFLACLSLIFGAAFVNALFCLFDVPSQRLLVLVF